MSCPDLKDLLFGELSPHERQEAKSHLEGCEHCRLEAERFRLTTAALRMMPDLEPPTHIRFVSDKVFQPRWGFFQWQSAMVGLFAAVPAMALLLLLVILRTPPAPKPVATTTSLTQAQINEQVRAAVDGQVKTEVAKAVADLEQRHQEQSRAMMAAFDRQVQADRKGFAQAVEAEYLSTHQVSEMAFAANEKLPVSGQ